MRPPLGLALAAVLLAGVAVVGVKLVRDHATAPAAAPSVPRVPTAAPTEAAAGPAVPVESPAETAPGPAVPAATVPPSRTPTRPPLAANPEPLPASSTFELVSDAFAVNLRTAAIGVDLYRISTAKGSGVRTQVKTDAAGVRLSLARSGKRDTATVSVVLNSRVRWSLKMTGGVTSAVLDLSGGTVGRVDLVGGATRWDLTLPRPTGTCPVRMSGGVNQLRIRTAGSVPVRVLTREGAGRAVFEGRTDDGVAKGSIFVSPQFASSRDRIDVDAVAGIGTLIVGRA